MNDMKQAIYYTLAAIMLTASAYCFVYLWESGKAQMNECTCRFQQRWHYSHTKVNRECKVVQEGVVEVDGTVYVNVEWYKNECN